MFTGLIEEVGTIKSVSSVGGGIKITVGATHILQDVKIDDSIAICGACQTVIEHTTNTFSAIAVEETLKKTTLGSLRIGARVNLERAMKIGDRLGGHLVQGHVDCTGKVASIEKLSTAVLLNIQFPFEFSKYLVNTGSVCIDGVSLTSAKVSNDFFIVSIIPHTWKVTTLGNLKASDSVNLEFDIIGKYISRIIELNNNVNSEEIPNKSILSQFIDQPEW